MRISFVCIEHKTLQIECNIRVNTLLYSSMVVSSLIVTYQTRQRDNVQTVEIVARIIISAATQFALAGFIALAAIIIAKRTLIIPERIIIVAPVNGQIIALTSTCVVILSQTYTYTRFRTSRKMNY